MQFKSIIGGIIAYVLLALYGGIAVYIIIRVVSLGNDASSQPLVIPEGMAYVLTTIGALVSALVIAKLAVTKPGTDPTAFTQFGSEQPKTLNTIVWSYLILWAVIGLTSLIVGVVIFPHVCKTLNEFGTTWLGTAVASAYAYFNIDPSK